MLMMDKNNGQIADLINKWLADRGCRSDLPARVIADTSPPGFSSLMQCNAAWRQCMAFCLGISGPLVHMLARFRATSYTCVL